MRGQNDGSTTTTTASDPPAPAEDEEEPDDGPTALSGLQLQREIEGIVRHMGVAGWEPGVVHMLKDLLQQEALEVLERAFQHSLTSSSAAAAALRGGGGSAAAATISDRDLDISLAVRLRDAAFSSIAIATDCCWLVK
eukprot:GHVU01230283.1.p1 GENE.GHVU01230283.1~~GHVU01230283.1.p1  ORF type:complete len:138 (-),score=33.35 GHVU01230283.1:899-1312(-)